MFSVPDILVVSVVALLLFGPDQLPKVLRQAGKVMRDLQNTSQSFVAEMERAADTTPQRASEAPPAPHPPPVDRMREPFERADAVAGEEKTP